VSVFPSIFGDANRYRIVLRRRFQRLITERVY